MASASGVGPITPAPPTPDTHLFWKNRGDDGLRREKQLLIDLLCASAGGPLYYVGRDMKTSHRGMGIREGDWRNFRHHLEVTLERFQVPASERAEVLAFIASTKGAMVSIDPDTAERNPAILPQVSRDTAAWPASMPPA